MTEATAEGFGLHQIEAVADAAAVIALAAAAIVAVTAAVATMSGPYCSHICTGDALHSRPMTSSVAEAFPVIAATPSLTWPLPRPSRPRS